MMDERFETKMKFLFAPGQICYPDEVQAVLRQAGLQGIALLCRHLAGDWGDIDEKRCWINGWVLDHPEDERRLPVISRYTLPDGRQVALITRHVHDPARRKTTLSLWPPVTKKPPAEDEADPLPRQNLTGESERRRQEVRQSCGPTKR